MKSDEGLLVSEVLPGDFVDAVIFLRDPLEGDIWVSSLEVSSGALRGEISSDEGVFAQFSATLDGGRSIIAPITSSDASLTGMGMLVLGNQENRFSGMATGKSEFTKGALTIQGCLIAKGISSGVRAITVNDTRVSGLVQLKEGAGIRFGVTQNSDQSILTINADGQFSDAVCDKDPILLSVNSVLPGSSGGIRITEGALPVPSGDYESRQVIRVTGIKNGIKVSLVDPNA